MAVSDHETLLKTVYSALIRHPHDKWRAENQTLYAAVRDMIASQVGIDSQSVQDWFEQEAVQDWFAKSI